jgi:hypothetical protein
MDAFLLCLEGRSGQFDVDFARLARLFFQLQFHFVKEDLWGSPGPCGGDL